MSEERSGSSDLCLEHAAEPEELPGREHLVFVQRDVGHRVQARRQLEARGSSLRVVGGVGGAAFDEHGTPTLAHGRCALPSAAQALAFSGLGSAAIDALRALFPAPKVVAIGMAGGHGRGIGDGPGLLAPTFTIYALVSAFFGHLDTELPCRYPLGIRLNYSVHAS